MANEKDSSLMSLYAYGASEKNTPAIAPPWTILKDRTEGTQGFAYAVFQSSSGEIVIAFRGSDDGADWLANTGLTIAQEQQAAVIAAQYINQYGANNVSFTGHSLGGGIAATMAVWFNRPATVFDPAPTQGVTTDLAVVNSIIGTLGGLNAPQTMRDYAAALTIEFAAREGNVTSYFAPGSVVYSVSTANNTVTGQGNPVTFGVDNMGSVAGRMDMHAQTLLTAGVLSNAFAQSTVAVQRALPLVFNQGLYNLNTKGTERNVFIDLIRNEQQAPGQGKLTHFAADLNKLGTNIAGLNVAAQDAIIAQGIEWYYWQSSNYAGQEFMTQTGELLQYTTAQGDDLTGAQNKSASYVDKWLVPLLNSYGETYYPNSGTKYQQWNVDAGSTGVNATARDATKSQVFVGQGGIDIFTGGSKDDSIFAGAGNDTLNGQAGNDKLCGGVGLDTYIVGNGKDTLRDNTDGEGLVRTEAGVTLSGGKAAGESNTWVGAQGETYTFLQTQAAQLGTLIIRNLGAGNEVRIEKFDLALAQSAAGYLGIKLDNTSKLVIKESTGSNPFSDFNFDPTAVTGTSAIIEGTGKTYTLFLNKAATAGETITLALSGLVDKFNAILGNSTVTANGAVITLAEGQTEVPFTLVQEGDVSADASLQISASYAGASSSATSNAWDVNLTDSGPVSQTFNGDQRAKLIGIETQLTVTADQPAYNTYAWEETSWAADGTLNGGVAEVGFSDVITGTTANDKISGLGGNDALDGGSGNDDIDGGAGDDLIGGDAGSDHILVGDGADYINSSAILNVIQRLKPTDSWSPPAGQVVLSQGALWGIYEDTRDGAPITIWSGSDAPDGNDGDVVDAGAGSDTLTGGGGNAALMNAIDLVDSCACHSDVAGRFDCKNRPSKVKKQCFRCRLEETVTKNIHARSIRLAGNEWRGRRMDIASCIQGVQTVALTMTVQCKTFRSARAGRISFNRQKLEVLQ